MYTCWASSFSSQLAKTASANFLLHGNSLSTGAVAVHHQGVPIGALEFWSVKNHVPRLTI